MAIDRAQEATFHQGEKTPGTFQDTSKYHFTQNISMAPRAWTGAAEVKTK